MKTDEITVEVYEYQEDYQSEISYRELSVEGTSVKIEISYDRESVKMTDSTGNYYYFQNIDEARKLRAMLDKLIELNPPMEE